MVIALKGRLAKMEELVAGKRQVGRIVSVIGGGVHSQAAITTFLASKGIVPSDDDMVVFRAITAPSPNGPVPTDDPLRLHYLGGERHDDWVCSGALDDDSVPLEDMP